LLDRCQASAKSLPHTLQVTAEKSAADMFREDGLRQMPGMQIRRLFNEAQTVNHVRRRDDPPDLRSNQANL